VIGISIDRSAAAARQVPQIRQEILCAMQCDARILITGTSATGTTAVAQIIHRHSPRAHRPFLKLNCARRGDLVLESRLFGRARHSFDGGASSSRALLEQAHGGTIFLGNIGQIGHALQARLLHFLKHGEIRTAAYCEPGTLLDRFYRRELDVRPGDALRCRVDFETSYGPDHEVLAERYRIVEVIEVLPAARSADVQPLQPAETATRETAAELEPAS